MLTSVNSLVKFLGYKIGYKCFIVFSLGTFTVFKL
jgi:hypothetical protein